MRLCIIWDPGAADGLMGTRTLLEYVRAFLVPKGLHRRQTSSFGDVCCFSVEHRW